MTPALMGLGWRGPQSPSHPIPKGRDSSSRGDLGCGKGQELHHGMGNPQLSPKGAGVKAGAGVEAEAEEGSRIPVESGNGPAGDCPNPGTHSHAQAEEQQLRRDWRKFYEPFHQPERLHKHQKWSLVIHAAWWQQGRGVNPRTCPAHLGTGVGPLHELPSPPQGVRYGGDRYDLSCHTLPSYTMSWLDTLAPTRTFPGEEVGKVPT